MSFKILYSTTEARIAFTFDKAELVFDVGYGNPTNGIPSASPTYNKLFVGDGVTIGGIPVDSSSITLLDETNLTTDSATSVPSQRSVKEYVDASLRGAENITITGVTINSKTNTASVLPSFAGFSVKLPPIGLIGGAGVSPSTHKNPGQVMVVANLSSTFNLIVQDNAGSTLVEVEKEKVAIFIARDQPNSWVFQDILSGVGLSTPTASITNIPVKGTIAVAQGLFNLGVAKTDIETIVGLDSLAYKATVGTIDIDANSITNPLLAVNAVDTINLMDDAVVTAKLLDRTITSVKIGLQEVKTDNIADHSITTAKIKDGTIQNGDIQNKTIEISKLKDIKSASLIPANNGTIKGNINLSLGSYGLYVDPNALGLQALAYLNQVGSAEIAPSAIDTTHISSDSITNSQMQSNSIDTGELIDNCVTQAKIGPNAVGTAELDAFAVLEGNIADGAVTTSKLSDGDVTLAKLDPTLQSAISGIVGGTVIVGATNIQNDAIQEYHIDDGQIKANHIESSFLTALQNPTITLAANSVDSAEIAANAVQNTHISNNTISFTKTDASFADNLISSLTSSGLYNGLVIESNKLSVNSKEFLRASIIAALTTNVATFTNLAVSGQGQANITDANYAILLVTLTGGTGNFDYGEVGGNTSTLQGPGTFEVTVGLNALQEFQYRFTASGSTLDVDLIAVGV